VLHDPLTGLADRALFAELVAQSYACRRSGECVCGPRFASTGFRLINEASVTRGTRSSCRRTASHCGAARRRRRVPVGGDEFPRAVRVSSRRGGRAGLAGRLREAVIGDPIDLKAETSHSRDDRVACTTSQVDPAELIDAALAGLHRAKAAHMHVNGWIPARGRAQTNGCDCAATSRARTSVASSTSPISQSCD